MNNIGIGEKFLPIGTVVMLKTGTKRLMITGFCSISTDDENVMYDYSGCMYPEGMLSSDQTALFNHEQIEKVYHMGLIDEEEEKFKGNLTAFISQISSEESINQKNITSSQSQGQQDDTSIPPIGPGLEGYVAPVVDGNNKESDATETRGQSTNDNIEFSYLSNGVE